MREQVVPEVELDLPGCDDDSLAGKECEKSGYKCESHDHPSPGKKLITHRSSAFDSRLKGVNRLSEEQRLDDRQQIAPDDSRESPQEGSLVTFEVWNEAKKGLHASYPITSKPAYECRTFGMMTFPSGV